eukprot:6308-Eustigmatos_ZCMA.PRE.1
MHILRCKACEVPHRVRLSYTYGDTYIRRPIRTERPPSFEQSLLCIKLSSCIAPTCRQEHRDAVKFYEKQAHQERLETMPIR